MDKLTQNQDIILQQQNKILELLLNKTTTQDNVNEEVEKDNNDVEVDDDNDGKDNSD